LLGHNFDSIRNLALRGRLLAYRNQDQQVVRLAAVAASTLADKNAEPFLTNEFNKMRALTDK